jgi:hypothetical protein
MTRAAIGLLTAGVLLFAGVLISQGLAAVFATLAVAGWGLPLVALLHLVPLALDAASIRVMFDTSKVRSSLRAAILARWVGESANSFLPAGPIGGPVVMSRYFSQHGMSMRDAAAGVTVSTTLQAPAARDRPRTVAREAGARGSARCTGIVVLAPVRARLAPSPRRMTSWWRHTVSKPQAGMAARARPASRANLERPRLAPGVAGGSQSSVLPKSWPAGTNGWTDEIRRSRQQCMLNYARSAGCAGTVVSGVAFV